MGPQGPPQRPMSQSVTNSQSISSVLQEEPPQRPVMQGNEYQTERMRKYEKDWFIEKERERERRQEIERERHREEEIDREREREREREMKDREREKEREKARARERAERANNTMQASLGQQVFGREPHRLEHQHQPPQTSSSNLSYPMTITAHPSRMSAAGQDTMAGPPPVSAISAPSTMALPQTSTSGTGGLGPTPAPLPTATTTGREGFQSFTGYTTPMPPSPFAITASLPVLPPVIEGGRDSRRQGFPLQVAGSPFGRDEPARAEDALQRGLSRQSSGLEEDRRRRAEKDRDDLMRDRDGHARMNGQNIGNQSPPKRGQLGGMEISSMTRNWSEDFQKGLMENSNREKEREEAGKTGIGSSKREREDDEAAKMMEKKTKKHHGPHHVPHHHHGPHVHQYVPQSYVDTDNTKVITLYSG